jgi:hypothetical protein
MYRHVASIINDYVRLLMMSLFLICSLGSHQAEHFRGFVYRAVRFLQNLHAGFQLIRDLLDFATAIFST